MSTADPSAARRLPLFLGRPTFWISAAFVVVVLRSAVWVLSEQIYFDSDQAITGLMAKHLAEGRAIPLIFYGQHYMLAVEAWLAAPLVAAFGASVLMLKLPLLAMNLLVAWLLVRLLVSDAELPPALAVVAALTFLLPSPIATSRLLEASGVAIEPFVYALLLWMTRDRPVLFGLVAGIGILNREFTVYAVTAIWILELWHGRLGQARALLNKAIVVAEVAAISVVVGWLKGHADLLGPGTAGSPGLAGIEGQAGFLASRFCFSWSEIAPNVAWLFRENLSALFGWRIDAFRPFFDSALHGSVPWVWVPLAVLLVSGIVGAARRRARLRSREVSEQVSADDLPILPAAPTTGPMRSAPASAFPAFLVLVGLQAVGVYALVTCVVRDQMLVRYTLLGLFVPVGAAAMALHPRAPVATRWMATATALLVAAGMAREGGRVAWEYVFHRPPNEFRELANFLDREGVVYGVAPYWTAYRIDFLTAERVRFTAYEKVRIQAYQDDVDRHEAQSLGVFFDDPCTDDGAKRVSRWCLFYLDRARHAR